MFVSAYSENRRSNYWTPSGIALEPTYSYEIDKKGLKNLKETGKKNVYEEIQAHSESTKIENVIQRVVAGDESVLRPDAIYADITDHPKNLMEAMEQIHALEETYNNLSKEAKKVYPTIESFVNNAGTLEWMKLNGYIENDIKESIKEQHVTKENIIEKAIEGGAPNES